MKKALQKQKGFTLIEVIVTIVLAALAGLVVFAYLGNVLTKSHIPLEMAKDLAETVQVMEEIVFEYQEYLKGGREPSDWEAFKLSTGATPVTAGPLFDAAESRFEIYEVTVENENQRISAFFTQ